MVNDTVMELCNISSNTIYWMYVTQKQAPLASIVKWEALYEMDSHVWMNIFRLNFQSVRETVIQSFQYRILLRVFPLTTGCINYTLNHTIIVTNVEILIVLNIF